MLVDCDVHPELVRPDDLARYIDDRYLSRFLGRAVQSVIYPAPNGGFRVDAAGDGSGRPGSDPAVLEAQLLEGAGVDYAILIPLVTGQSVDPELNAASQAGVNRWMAECWLSEYNRHGRYRGSISVPINNPAAAVAEIERWGSHPYFAQVWVPHRSPLPYGHPQYRPIWEAAARHGLPVAVHANGAGQSALPTPVGYCHYYIELHSVAEALAYAAHFTSLICEGLFDQVPGLRFVFVEGGFSWVAPLIWKLDRAWPQLRADCPGAQRLPSEYLYGHIRFTSQPVEEPADDRDLLHLYDLIDASRVLMFATDYPHWDYDDPARALPRLPAAQWRRIAYENAVELYRLPVN